HYRQRWVLRRAGLRSRYPSGGVSISAGPRTRTSESPPARPRRRERHLLRPALPRTLRCAAKSVILPHNAAFEGGEAALLSVRGPWDDAGGHRQAGELTTGSPGGPPWCAPCSGW